MTKPSIISHSVFLALISCFLWSTAFAGIKIGLAYTTPLQFAGIRFIISGIIIFPFIRNKTKAFDQIKQHLPFVLLISLLQTSVLYAFFYQGIARTPAAISAVVVGAGPLFIALMAHFITGKDPLTLRKAVALLIGFLGIVLLALMKDTAEKEGNTIAIGIGFLIVANVSGGLGNILVSRNRRGMSPIALSATQLFTGGVTLLLISVLVEGASFNAKPLPYYLALGWLSFLSAAAFTIWFVVLGRPEVKVSEINVWKFVIPVLGALISWLLIPEESPNFWTFLAMFLIALAIILMYGHRWFKARQKTDSSA
ncbi:MAG: DMT family transporter [Deltaproteobacteria bacterium]|nr:DMT family transporter [Deltaproteobacteria bacterium]